MQLAYQYLIEQGRLNPKLFSEFEVMTNYKYLKTMKNLFYIIIVSLFISGCDKDCEHLGDYIFTDEQLQYVPYNLNETVSFTTSAGEIISGIVTNKNILHENYKINGTCNYIVYEDIYSTITFNENHTISVDLSNLPYTSNTLIVSLKSNDKILTFQPINTNKIEELTFESIVLNEQIFTNCILLVTKHENNIANKIVYSKTNGIEFILFEDGSWYKRLAE